MSEECCYVRLSLLCDSINLLAAKKKVVVFLVLEEQK